MSTDLLIRDVPDDVVEAIDQVVLEGMEGISERRPNIFVLIEDFETIPVWQYWEWHKRRLYPDSTVVMSWTIAPDDNLDEMRSKWDGASRRFFVNPSGEWIHVLSPSDSGELRPRYGNGDFELVEWLPAGQGIEGQHSPPRRGGG